MVICCYLPIVHGGNDKFPCNIMARSKVCVHTCFSPADPRLCRCFPIKSSTGVVKTIATSESKWERKRHQHYHWTCRFGQVYYHWPSGLQIWWNQQTDNRKFKKESAEMEKGFFRYACVLDKFKFKHECGYHIHIHRRNLRPANV